MKIDWEAYKKWYTKKFPGVHMYDIDETKMKLGSSYLDPKEGLMWEFTAGAISGHMPERCIIQH